MLVLVLSQEPDAAVDVAPPMGPAEDLWDCAEPPFSR